MKIKNDFITNSSSSSFIVAKNKLSNAQIKKIYNHVNYIKKEKCFMDFNEHQLACYAWSIFEDEDKILMYTSIDNFDMYDYLINIVGINPIDIKTKE